MEILQNIDLSNPTLLVVLCPLLCIGLFVLGFVLQFVGTILEVFFSIIEIFFQVLSGGPVAWCGCLVMIGLIGGCFVFGVLILLAIPECGTAQASNLCNLLGY